MRRTLFAAAVAAACLASVSLALQAQPYGPGGGPGKMGAGTCCGANDTPGWALMTTEERNAHRDKMRGFKDAESCSAYMTGHHKAMEARARERGQSMGMHGPGPGCDYLKKKG